MWFNRQKLPPETPSKNLVGNPEHIYVGYVACNTAFHNYARDGLKFGWFIISRCSLLLQGLWTAAELHIPETGYCKNKTEHIQVNKLCGHKARGP